MVHPNLLAAEIPLGPIEGLGPFGKFASTVTKTPETAVSMFAKIISNAIGVMTIVAFIWFIFILFVGAIGIIGAGGDKTRIQSSQKQITNGLVGLVLVIGAIFLTKLLGTIFGVDILSFSVITNLWP